MENKGTLNAAETSGDHDYQRQKLQNFYETMKRTAKNPETVLSADIETVSHIMTNPGDGDSPTAKSINEQSLELSVPRCLESVGISCLNEWDVLVFMYRHGTSLANANQIAPLIGYEGVIVARTLDWLEREKLIERSRASRGVHFYQIVVSTDAGRQRCLQQLIALSETRTGRLLLAKHLKAVRRRSLEKEGKWLCLKAI